MGEKQDHEDIYKEAGIQVNENRFSRKNLIIGKNGSGKTRFLKAIERIKTEEAAKKNKKIRPVTLYFPEIHSYYKQLNDIHPPDKFDCVHDFLMGRAEIGFHDFLKIMEDDRMRFGRNLIYGNLMEGLIRDDANQILERINNHLKLFLSRRMEVASAENRIIFHTLEEDKVVRTVEFSKAMEEFSPGEIILFYMSFFFSVIENQTYDGLILILDEPELHLHPGILLRFLEQLEKNDMISELWIASLPFF